MTTYGRTKDSATEASEHVQISSGGTGAKRVLMAGYDGANFNDASVDSTGAVKITGTTTITPSVKSVLRSCS